MNRKTCIIITGPTAVGKTDFGIELAQKHNTQIISADSRQCYRQLNIGVSKPSPAQLNSIEHHFINTHSIHDDVNVKIFEQYALNAAKKIFETNNVAIIVGGTGLYIKAFCDGIDDVPLVNEKIRNEINIAYNKNGIEWLKNEIQKKDPVYFASGEMQNPQRMMRALEVKSVTGNSILDFHSGKKIKRDFEIKKINLELPRNELYERINKRVDNMVNTGLLKEAENLFAYRDLNALNTVGYKELFDFMKGKTMPDGIPVSLDKTIDNIKKNTRHFAKRQITWFKKFN